MTYLSGTISGSCALVSRKSSVISGTLQSRDRREAGWFPESSISRQKLASPERVRGHPQYRPSKAARAFRLLGELLRSFCREMTYLLGRISETARGAEVVLAAENWQNDPFAIANGSTCPWSNLYCKRNNPVT